MFLSSSDRFHAEAPGLDPIMTGVEEIFLAGYCQGPKDIPDTVAQASMAAAMACTLLVKGRKRLEDATFCAGCGLCEQICEYRALKLDPFRNIMTVNEALCKGCGACNAACPSGAISLRHFKTEQIIAQIREVC